MSLARESDAIVQKETYRKMIIKGSGDIAVQDHKTRNQLGEKEERGGEASEGEERENGGVEGSPKKHEAGSAQGGATAYVGKFECRVNRSLSKHPSPWNQTTKPQRSPTMADGG